MMGHRFLFKKFTSIHDWLLNCGDTLQKQELPINDNGKNNLDPERFRKASNTIIDQSSFYFLCREY